MYARATFDVPFLVLRPEGRDERRALRRDGRVCLSLRKGWIEI